MLHMYHLKKIQFTNFLKLNNSSIKIYNKRNDVHHQFYKNSRASLINIAFKVSIEINPNTYYFLIPKVADIYFL